MRRFDAGGGGICDDGRFERVIWAWWVWLVCYWFFRLFQLDTRKKKIIDVFIQTISHLCHNNTLVILHALNCFSLCFCFFCHFYLNKSHAFQQCAFFNCTRLFWRIRHLSFFRWTLEFSGDERNRFVQTHQPFTLLPPPQYTGLKMNTFEIKMKWIHIISTFSEKR